MSDAAYFARREILRRTLAEQYTYCTNADLVELLGWTSHEIRAKLMSLRSDGLVTYDGYAWAAEE